jgi:hypothetical protein
VPQGHNDQHQKKQTPADDDAGVYGIGRVAHEVVGGSRGLGFRDPVP